VARYELSRGFRFLLLMAYDFWRGVGSDRLL
jgi:hypothetical protein